MTTLTDLTSRLAGLVPAQNGALTTAQYKQAARDAVADFGRRVPRRLIATISVASGTAAYDLPAGFQKVIRLEPLAGRDVQRNAMGFLVPPPLGGWQERYTISGGQITFYPTPNYTLERTLLYAAGYPYDNGDDVFTGLLEGFEDIVLMKAQAVTHAQVAAAAVAGYGLSYRIGDVSVERSLTPPQNALIDDLNRAYLSACSTLVGRIGMRSSYDGTEYSER